MKRRPTLSLVFLILLLLITAAVAGSYLYRDLIKNRALSLVAERLELSNLDFDGLRLNADGMQLDELRFSHSDDKLKQNLTLQGIKLGFSVFPLNLSELRVTEGTLDMEMHTDTAAVTSRNITDRNITDTTNSRPHTTARSDTTTDVNKSVDQIELLPSQLTDLAYAHIDRLTGNIKLPAFDKPIQFDGVASWRSNGEQIRVDLKNATEQFTITSDPDLSTATLTVETDSRDDSTAPIVIVVDSPLTSNPGFSVSSSYATLVAWIQSSRVLPDELRQNINDFRTAIEAVNVTKANIVISGYLDREAPWPLSAVRLKSDWQQIRHGNCQIEGAIHGTWNSINSKIGYFIFNESKTLTFENCIDSPDAKTVQSTIKLDPQAGFNIAYDFGRDNTPYIEVNGPLELDLIHDRIKLTVNTDNFRLVDAWNETGLPDIVTGDFETSVEYDDFSQRIDDTVVTADYLRLNGTVSISQTSRETPYELSSPDLGFNAASLYYQTTDNRLTIENIDGTANTTARLKLSDSSQSDQLLLNGAIDLSLTTSPVDIEFQSGALPGRLRIADVRLRGETVTTLSEDKNAVDSVELTLDYETNALRLSDPVLGADTLSGQAKLNWNGKLDNKLDMNTTVSLTNLYGDDPIPPMTIEKLEGNVALSEDRLRANGTLELTPELVVPWSASGDTDGYVIDTEMTTPVPVLVDWLKPALGPTADSFNILSGIGSFNSSVAVADNNVSMAASASLSDLSGSFEELQFNDGRLDMNATNLAARQLNLNVEVPNGELANGTSFSKLATDIRVDGDEITIDQFAVSAFDANFFFNNLVFGQPDLSPSSVLKVDELDLGVATTELGKEGLQATGTMSGEIPFRILQSGVAIDDGRLQSDQSGFLAYSSGSGQNIEGLNNIALQALENFHHESIILNLGYTEDGQYSARFKLSGNNPDLYDGYPVVLNLNINGQLPGLLRSTLIGGSFDEEILRTLPKQRSNQ